MIPLSLLITAIGICVAVAYAIFAATPFFLGPEINAVTVTPVSENTVAIEGQATRVSDVWINDLPVPISETGHFLVERAFPPGYTVLTVRAEDRFMRIRSKTITFLMNSHAQETSESKDHESSI